MKRYAHVVDVPDIQPEEMAYDHDRPISGLLLQQLRNLSIAEHQLPEEDRTGVNIHDIHTELAASNYIRRVTKKLQSRLKQSSAKKIVRSQSKKSSAKTSSARPSPNAKKRK